MQPSSAHNQTWPGRQFTGPQLFGVVFLSHVLLVWLLVHGGEKMSRPVPVELYVRLIAAESPIQRPTLPDERPKQIKIANIAKSTVPLVSEIPPTQITENDASTAPVSVEPAATVSANIPPVLAVALQPKMIASDVEYIRPPQIAYPVISRRKHEQGKTILRVLINENGLPEKAEIKESSGSRRLDDAALSAVLGALFKPCIENGKPAAVYALVPIRFQLDG